MFKNKTFEGIHYSRFIASWTNVGGPMNWRFKEWLKTLTINGKSIPEEVVNDIYNLASNGKLELETQAKIFIDKH